MPPTLHTHSTLFRSNFNFNKLFTLALHPDVAFKGRRGRGRLSDAQYTHTRILQLPSSLSLYYSPLPSLSSPSFSHSLGVLCFSSLFFDLPNFPLFKSLFSFVHYLSLSLKLSLSFLLSIFLSVCVCV